MGGRVLSRGPVERADANGPSAAVEHSFCIIFVLLLLGEFVGDICR